MNHDVVRDVPETLDDVCRRVGHTPDYPGWGGTDKGEGHHDYLRHYERLLGHLRHEECRLLEVGVAGGGGLRTWAEWAPRWRITGIEIDPKLAYQDPPRVHTRVGDVRKIEFIWPIAFDVIIDDGSHDHDDVLAAYHRLIPHLAPCGFYFIEDVSSPIAGIAYEEVCPYLMKVVTGGS